MLNIMVLKKKTEMLNKINSLLYEWQDCHVVIQFTLKTVLILTVLIKNPKIKSNVAKYILVPLYVFVAVLQIQNWFANSNRLKWGDIKMLRESKSRQWYCTCNNIRNAYLEKWLLWHESIAVSCHDTVESYALWNL